MCLTAVLNPGYKLRYFKDHKWLPEWIDEARRLVTTAWEEHYKPPPPKPPVRPRPVNPGRIRTNVNPPVRPIWTRKLLAVLIMH